jgi:hypothetical protein
METDTERGIEVSVKLRFIRPATSFPPFSVILFNINPPFTSKSSYCSLTFSFPYQNSVCNCCPIRTTFRAHLLFLDSIILIIDDDHKIRSSSLHRFFSPPCFFFPLRSKYSSQHPLFKHLPTLFPIWLHYKCKYMCALLFHSECNACYLLWRKKVALCLIDYALLHEDV